MTAEMMTRRGSLLALMMAGGIGAAFAVGWGMAQVPTAPATFKPEVPAYRGLDANLYMQTSAEYRAACFQAFNLAAIRLKEAVVKKSGGKLAVIMDLDETVFDNAGFQAMQLRSNLAYDQRLWDVWEEKHSAQVGLVPGARDFIRQATELNVAVAYLSNRNERYREQTKQTLARMEIPVADEGLLKLASDTSDKTKRRRDLEASYEVVLIIGDNLRDFDESYRCRKLDKRTPEELELAIRERKATVDRQRDIWGDKWIILPNPAYGEWMKPLGNGQADLDRLVSPVDGK